MSDRRFFMYVRKSTDTKDKQVRSIDDQLAELNELAQRESLHVVDVFQEKQTAKIPGRPQFDAMVKRIARGEANGILAWHPDRLARNATDGGSLIQLFDHGKLHEVRFPNLHFRGNPQDKFMLTLAFGQSKLYVDNLSDTIKRSHRQKLKNGFWPNAAPTGYTLHPTSKALVIEREAGALVRTAFERYASGNYSAAQLAVMLGEQGLRGRWGGGLTPQRVLTILRNPVYSGLLRHNGELYEGNHDPLVPKSLFDRVQEMLSRARRPKTRSLKPFRYRGLFSCAECGCMITSEKQKGHVYLRCTKRKGACSQSYTREEHIDEQVRQAVASVGFPGTITRWVVNQLKAEGREMAQGHQEFVDAIDRKLQTCDTKLDRLLSVFLAHHIDDDEYQTHKNKLVEEKQRLREQRQSPAGFANWFEPAVEFMMACNTAFLLGINGKPDDILKFFKKVGSNCTIQNAKITWEPVGAWKTIVAQRPFRNQRVFSSAGSSPDGDHKTRESIRCAQ